MAEPNTTTNQTGDGTAANPIDLTLDDDDEQDARSELIHIWRAERQREQRDEGYLTVYLYLL